MGTPLKTSWNHRFRGMLAALLMVGVTLAAVSFLTSQHSSAQQARQQGADNALLQVATEALEQAEQLQRDVRLTCGGAPVGITSVRTRGPGQCCVSRQRRCG